MKHIFTLLILTTIVISCNKTQNDDSFEDQYTTVVLSLSNSDSQTDDLSKAQGQPPTLANDNKINDFTILVFNATSKILTTQKTATANEISNLKISFTTTVGQKDIYVIANVGASGALMLNSVASLDDLSAFNLDLKNEVEGNFSMLGKVENVSIQSTGNSISIPLSRTVSRILINDVKTQFTGSLTSTPFMLDSLYILTAQGNKSYLNQEAMVPGGVIYNRAVSNFTYPHVDRFNPALLLTQSQTLGSSIGVNNTKYYVYANNSTDFAGATKFVISGTINNVRQYYTVPININGYGHTPSSTLGITSNRQYYINVTIKGYGSDNPNSPATNASCDLTLNIENWSIFSNNVEYN